MGPDAVAILQGASLMPRSNDTHYPFRQNSDFWYITGFDHPDATAILSTIEGRPRYTLFVQPRDPAAESWTGFRPGLEGATKDYGADESAACDSFLDALPELLKGSRRIFHSFGIRRELDAKLTEIQETLRSQSRKGDLPAEEYSDPRSMLHEMRLFKSPEEVAIMRSAAEITCHAHREAAQLIAPGRYEYEIEAALEYAFRRRGGAGAAYASIVAGGPRATILHYIRNDQRLRDGEMVLIDAGAECEGYASDVSRTYPIGGRFEGAGRELYEVVLAAQLAGIAGAKPGTTLPDIHALTSRRLVEGLLDLGLLSGEADELIAAEEHRRFYIHGTSHWLGLDVHDVGRYTEAGEARPLEAGMVLTIEPGLYISEEAEDVPAAFRGIGVRIEDDLVITAEGHENLNDGIPKHPSDVEDWLRGDA
jgi:Xaa-Pro aminopeptidase